MTATILKPQATQATRTIALTVPADAPNPKFNLGDRVISFISENPNDPDIHAGVITGISLEDEEWQYHVLPGDDENLQDLCVCDNTEDEFTWFEEHELEFLNPTTQAKAEWLLSEAPSYEEVRAKQLMFMRSTFPENFDDTEFGKYVRAEWNELIDEGYIPESLGRMAI